MKKSLKFVGVLGVVCSLLVMPQVSFAGNSGGSGVLSIGKVISDIGGLMVGYPVLDLASVPAHAIVSIEQEFIRMRTEIEDETKQQIKERLSVTKNNVGQTIDTQLSEVKILSEEANKLVSEGIAGKGIIVNGKGEIEADAEKETFDLAIQQQANWTSAAGSLRSMEEYKAKRAYIEQEQAIRLLGTVGVLRKKIQDQLMCQKSGPLKHLDSNYEQSDAKKDLDPNRGNKTVEKTNDYNQVFRQYAFNGLLYDQFLSLEQQLLGLRLQAVAGQKAQNMTPLSDKLETKSQSDEAETEVGK